MFKVGDTVWIKMYKLEGRICTAWTEQGPFEDKDTNWYNVEVSGGMVRHFMESELLKVLRISE